MSEMDFEKPADDAFEQERDLVENDDEEEAPRQHDGLPLDANEADAVEQEISVDDDDDYYR